MIESQSRKSVKRQLSFNRKILALALAALATNHVSAQDNARREPDVKIEQISVIGRHVPDEKRGTSAVSNVVGEVQFARSGDSNISETLKRVAGLSTVGGKYVYVRGLGERYSTTLLNGAVLPSPEPINRVVPMDMFPTAVLDSVLVQKTYSAEFPSEFGGGILQLRTKKSTDEAFWTISSGFGIRPDVNFKSGLTASGGNRDWLGSDDGTRSIPKLLDLATTNGVELRRASKFSSSPGYTSEELQTIGRSLSNNYEIRREDLPANKDLSTAFGNFHELGESGATFNYMAAINYSNNWNTDKIERNSYKVGNGELEQGDDLDYVGTKNSINISSIVTAGIDINSNHNVRLTSVLLRTTDNLVSELTGDLAAENIVRINELEWIERELFSNQIQGDHYFPQYNDLVINWRYSNVTAGRDSPDHRRYRYDLFDSGYEFSTRSDGNVRRFSDLKDTTDDYGIDFTMAFYGGDSISLTAKTGYVHTNKDRESEIRRYSFFDRGEIASDRSLLKMPLETVLAAKSISPDGFELREFTRPTDNYTATNESDAYYAQGELNFDDRFRFGVGLRNERFQQNVTTFDLFNASNVIKASQKSDDLVPALSATLINGDHQFRLAYSETLSRPDFRELSPTAFTNPLTGYEVVGNPDLQIAGIKNYDFRWEWYFDYSDYVSFGLFYKEFDKPIESVIQAGADKRRSFANADSGQNRGAEFEISKNLSFLGGIAEDFYFQGNISYIDSTVTIAAEDRGVLTNIERPLQGQSDVLFNAQVGYEPFSGVTATLLYHYFGERISEVGTSGAPDLIAQPVGELNFVYLQELGDHWKYSLKAKNLTNEQVTITQGGKITTGYWGDRELSFGVDYKF